MTNKLISNDVLLSLPLRMGNIYFGLVGAVFYMALSIRLIHLFVAGSHLFSDHIYFVSITLSVVHSVLCLTFVVGILKRNGNMLMPWLLSQILMTTLMALHFVLSRAGYAALFTFNWITIQAFIWLCGYSLYKRTLPQWFAYDGSSTGSDSFASMKYHDRMEYLEISALENVLFYIPLRIGNILLGVAGTVFYLLLCIWFAIKSTSAEHSSHIFNLDFLIIASLIQSIVCAIFVAGIIKKKQHMLVPWLFSQIILIYMEMVYYFLFWSQVSPIAFEWILVQGYVWWCGYSIYQRPLIHPSESDTPKRKLKLRINDIFGQPPELPVLENVLFIVPLQIGNIVIGLTSAIFYMMISIYLLVKCLYCINRYNHIPSKFYYISMISVLLPHSITCVIFVVGILKKRRRMLLPWLVSQILVTVATVIIHYLMYRSFDFVTLAINWTIIQAYIWFCGYSIYKRMHARGAEYNSIPSTETEKFTLCEYQDLDLSSYILVLNNVLFFIPIRIGNILLGLTGTILCLVIGICLLIKYTNDAQNFSDKLYFLLMISVLLGHSILCASFVVGIVKKKHHLLFPWLFSQILLTITTVVLQFIYNPNHVVVSLVIYWTAFQAYIWVCGYSIFQRIRTSSESDDISHNPNVPVLDSVLFFIPLRIGNIFLGSIGALFYWVTCIYLIAQCTKHAVNFIDKFYFISLISISLVHSIQCVIFVVGILKKQQRMLLPWLFSQVITTVAAVTINLIGYRPDEYISLAISWIIFQSYIWLCGYSIYQLKGADYSVISSTDEDFDFLADLPVLKKVLFCIPLKIGNICMALTGALVYLVLGIAFINKFTIEAPHTSQKFHLLSMISVLLIHAMACVIFVIGILKEKQFMLMPWLFSQILIVFVPVALQCLMYRSPDFVSFAIDWIILQAYIWLCGYSFFQHSHKRSAQYEILQSSEKDTFSGILIPSNYQDLDYTLITSNKTLKVCNEM